MRNKDYTPERFTTAASKDRVTPSLRKGRSTVKYAVILMTALTVLGAAMTRASIFESDNAYHHLHSTQAFYIAEGGIERAIYQLNQDASWRAGWSNENLGTGTYSVTVTDVNPILLKITAEAKVNNVTKKISSHVVNLLPQDDASLAGYADPSVNPRYSRVAFWVGE